MNEGKVLIHRIQGSGVNILSARRGTMKLNKSGVFICKEGEMVVNIDGNEHTVSPHSLVVYFSNTALQIVSYSNDLSGVLIGADLEMLQPLLFKITNFNALFIIKQHPVRYLTEEQYDSFSKYITLYSRTHRNTMSDGSGMTKQMRVQNEMAKTQLNMLVNCIMLEVVTCFADLNVETAHMSRHDEILQKFITMLYRNYRRQHEVSFYANQLCLTSRYFSAIIKERSGKTPSLWIATALLVDAKRQLKETNMSIKEVSDLLQFPTQSYFGKWFKNLTGVNPLEYRYGREPSVSQDKDFADEVERGLSHVKG